MIKCNNCSEVVDYTIRGLCRKCSYPRVKTRDDKLKDEIGKLIDKYDDKRLEEPDYYFQWEEVIEDLKALLREVKEYGKM